MNWPEFFHISPAHERRSPETVRCDVDTARHRCAR